MTDILDAAALVALDGADALTVFKAERVNGHHPIDPILARVRQEVDAFKAESLDLAVLADRKRIGSMAYRISQAKSALKTVGDELAKEAKSIPKRIDATRKHIADTLDAWRDEVRKPLDEWEVAEDARIAGHSGALRAIAEAATPGLTAAVYRQRLADVRSQPLTVDACQEFLTEYQIAIASAIPALESALAKAEKAEADAAELAALRAESAKRKAEEDAERLRKEGEDRARIEAEADARAERERAEREKEALRLQLEKAEAERQAAIDEAERKAIAAAAQAKAEVEAKARAEAEDKTKREADKAHRAKINREAVNAFVQNGADEDTAKYVVTLIAKGKIPNVTINY